MYRNRHPVIYGEVLFDKFPDGSVVPGGAPFNVAWHLQAFGMRPYFISRVGDDSLGRNIRNLMQEWGLNTAGLQMDSLRPTGTVEVSFHDGEPEFDIVNDRAYDHIEADSIPPVDASLLYHGTLILRGSRSAQSLTLLREKFHVPVFLDVNLRPPWWERNQVADSMRYADCVKLNESELDILTGDKRELEVEAASILKAHDINQLIVTCGAHGAISIASTDSSYKVTPESGAPDVVDTVGAGDAFSSVVILGKLLEWPIQTTLERAQKFASAIIGIRGAVISDRKFYQPFIKDWNIFDS